MKKVATNKSGNVHATKVQLRAIGEAADFLSGMIGGGSDFDVEAKKVVKNIDRFLKKNNLKRDYS